MSLALANRFAWRELRGGLRGFRIFLACLALGVTAIAAVGTVRMAITEGLSREGAALLGGDAEVRFTYRFATEDERTWMDGIAERVSETLDFRSMVVVGDERALTQVQTVDDLYPLIGEVTLEPPMPLGQALDGADGLPGGVLERTLADRLGLVPGDRFSLGVQEFVLSAILIRYPDNAVGGFGLGPRTIVRTTALDDAGLLAEGTLFETNYRLDLPAEADLQALEEEAEALFRDTGLRWQDLRQGAGGTARFVETLGRFLVLIGLAGLAVGGVGISAAVRSYLGSKAPVIATLRTLGATRRTIFLTYFIQVAVLMIAGILIGLTLGAGIPLMLAPIIEARLPIPAAFCLYPAPLAEAALYGVLATMIFTLWPLSRTEDIRAATLFRDGGTGGRRVPRWPYLAATVVLLVLLIGAAMWFTESWMLTLGTAGGIAASLAVLALMAALARWGARRLARRVRGRPVWRWALGAIGARGGETTSVILSLGLGLTVLSAIGQVDGNIQRAITEDLPEVAPSYFFLDIQPDQIAGYQERLASDAGVSRVDSAPMLRGIITQINGQPAREVTDHWVIRGDRGVTYSDAMPDGTVLTQGDWWPEGYDGPPVVSFAAEEAMEMGLQLGDTITVNILGRDFTPTITSFREVDFGTAGIGFILAMNPSALRGAPHSWISTVYAEAQAEPAILRDLGRAYPNITAIPVREAVDQVAELVAGIAAATRYGALATLLTGALVLIGAAAAGERARTYESAVLKTLGATRGRILTSFALRAGLMGMGAGAVALLAGIAGSWAVVTFVMEQDYVIIWPSAVGIVVGGALATLLAGLAYAWRPLAARPARVLRAQE